MAEVHGNVASPGWRARQELQQQAKTFRAEVQLFYNGGWPYMGSGYGLLQQLVEPTLRPIGHLIEELTRNRGALSSGYVADLPLERSATLNKLEALSSGVATGRATCGLPDLLEILNDEMRPEAERLRAGCAALDPQQTPQQILQVSHAVISSLDWLLTLGPIEQRSQEIYRELQSLSQAASSLWESPGLTKRLAAATEALRHDPPVNAEVEAQQKGLREMAARMADSTVKRLRVAAGYPPS